MTNIKNSVPISNELTDTNALRFSMKQVAGSPHGLDALDKHYYPRYLRFPRARVAQPRGRRRWRAHVLHAHLRHVLP
jgi:hypothetical protein